MSYAPKSNRPDSRDTAKLRAEYQKKVAEFQDSKDPASRAKLKDDKQKLFGRVVEQMTGERRDEVSSTQKALQKMGLFKSADQMKAEAEKLDARREQRLLAEQR